MSDRQWRDVVGIFGIHRESMDQGSLRPSVAELGLVEELDDAIRQAGPTEAPQSSKDEE